MSELSSKHLHKNLNFLPFHASSKPMRKCKKLETKFPQSKSSDILNVEETEDMCALQNCHQNEQIRSD